MKLGEKAQAGLDRCLKTKEVLKKKIKMCHDKRDEARQKLQECLERKKVLTKQIEACHVKRDEARKKLEECLSRKKVLGQKIAALKKKGVSLELTQLANEQVDVIAEAQAAQAALHQTNQDLAQAQDLEEDADTATNEAIDGMAKSSTETTEALQEVAATKEDEADAVEEGQNVIDGLNSVVTTCKEAQQQNQGALVEVQALSSQVILLTGKISKLMM